MQVLSLIWGVLAGMVAAVAFLPCLGALNWLVIPFAGLGFIFSTVALVAAKKDRPRGGSIGGVILCGVVTIFGIIRLVLGGGVV